MWQRISWKFHENFTLEKALIANFPRLQYIFKFIRIYVRIHSVNYTVISYSIYTWHGYADAGRCNVCGIELPFAYSLSLIMPDRKKCTACSETNWRDEFSCRFSDYIHVDKSVFFPPLIGIISISLCVVKNSCNEMRSTGLILFEYCKLDVFFFLIDKNKSCEVC